jgi:hypothetical protein
MRLEWLGQEEESQALITPTETPPHDDGVKKWSRIEKIMFASLIVSSAWLGLYAWRSYSPPMEDGVR